MRSVLVTLTTRHDTRDLEMPAEVAVRDLLPALLDLCGLPPSPQGQGGADGASGAVWTLGLEGIGPLPAARSLLECEIVDGMRLLLLDSHAWRALGPRAPAHSATPRAGAGGIGVRWRRDGLLPNP